MTDYIIKKASSLSTEEKTALGIVGIPDNWPVEMYPWDSEEIPEPFEWISGEGLELLKANNQASFDAWIASKTPVVIRPNEQSVLVTKMPDPAPFAQPVFRTKRAATSDIVEVAPGTTEHIDYVLAAERYVAGGVMLVSGAEFGDYFTAEVTDPNGCIPEPYRAALCENWPIVSTYIEKEWVDAVASVVRHVVDTYPLNAKITAGLVLCITYHATSAGGTRKVAVNYRLSKKL